MKSVLTGNKRDALGASFFLPLAAFLLSLLLITAVLPRAFTLRNASKDRSHSQLKISPSAIANIDLNQVEPRWSKPSNEKISTLLNLPGMLGEFAISLPTSWPESWHPPLEFPFNDLWFWRSVSWPVFAVPFWWLAGRALDVLFFERRRAIRIRIRELIFMVPGALLFGVIVTVISLQPDDDLHYGFAWAIIPGVIWTFLGLCSVWAFIVQARDRRRLRRTALAS